MKYWSISLLFFLSVSTFADVVIYRWVDDNGVVHFSQNQPAVGNYTELVMANEQLSDVDKNTPTTKQATSVQTTNTSSVSENLTVDTEKQCEEAKKNLATLSEFNRVRFLNADGEAQLLNEEEQKEQVIINQKRVDLYCKS